MRARASPGARHEIREERRYRGSAARRARGTELPGLAVLQAPALPRDVPGAAAGAGLAWGLAWAGSRQA